MKFHLAKAVFFGLALSTIILSAPIDARESVKTETFAGLIDVPVASLNRTMKVFVRYFAPVANPTNPEPVLFVNLNGMSYTTHSWDHFLPEQLADGDGVLLFDFLGQGRTLDANLPLDYDIPYTAQTEILEYLLKNQSDFQIDSSNRQVLFGVSYGGAVLIDYLARNPNANAEGIAAAPYVHPHRETDGKIRQQITWLNYSPFFAQMSYEEKYKLLLWQDILLYPILEPIMTRYPLDTTFNAYHRLVWGMHYFRGQKLIQHFPLRKLHGIIAGRDQYIKNEVETFFHETAGAENLASLLVLPTAEHKIPEATPATVLNWMKMIARKDPVLQSGGRVFEAQTESGQIFSTDSRQPVLDLQTPEEVVRQHATIWFDNFTRATRRWHQDACKAMLGVFAPAP